MSEKDNKLPWFRLYTETVDDEKLRLLAFEDRWHFIALLCCKGSGLLDSNDPLLRRKLSVKMGLATRELDEVVRRLSEVGLIDFDTLQPISWNSRQMMSDSSTARVKAYRERMKRNGNVSVTAQEEEEDLDKEEKKEQTPSRKRSASTRSEKTLLEDWINTEREAGNGLIASDDKIFNEGIPKEYVVIAWKVFRDDMLEKKKKQIDWRQTFRNYVRKDYLKLWAINREGGYFLTTAGKQAFERYNTGSSNA